MRRSVFAKPLVLALLAAFATSASAQLAISSNDGKVTLVNGVASMPAKVVPDTIAILELSGTPRVIAEIEVPGSFMGPPSNVAISPDGRMALIASAYKINPADPKGWIPDNKVAVVDLKSSPPKVIATVECGAAPSGLSFNKEGSLALVANRSDGTVTVLKIAGTSVTRIDSLQLGPATSGPSHVAFTPDGKMALVTRDGDSAVSVLSVNGDKVEYNKRDLFPGIRPYGLVIAPDGKSAVVALVGRGTGDADAIASIDLTGKWPRVAEHLTIGQTPEAISMSADGKMVAVSVINGSNKAKDFPWYSGNGKVVLVRVDGTKLTRLSEAPVGAWVQGNGFSGDGRKLFAQNILENQLQVLDIDANGQLKDSGQRIPLKASPVGMRVLGAP
ncbi:hypothetical protein BWI17_15125 [Betaproteobacteria bacterium GR16-43]|nr:hypothetical protein BWI17_15125 [Betaproteobacteria bacterium GR16-43]